MQGLVMPSGLFTGHPISVLPTRYLVQVRGSPALPPPVLEAIEAELRRRVARKAAGRAFVPRPGPAGERGA